MTATDRVGERLKGSLEGGQERMGKEGGRKGWKAEGK